MAALDTKYIVNAQPDGYVDKDIIRTRLFRKTAVNFGTTNPGDALAASTNYAVAKFPKGFVPRSAIVNVLKANASAVNLTVNVAKNATNIASATVAAINSSATAATGSVGTTLIDFKATTVETVTTGVDPWVTGADDYLVLTVGGAVDAEFEVVVCGDWPCLARDRND